MRHVLAAAEAIGSYVERGRSAFDTDRALQDAIVLQIVVLGEAAKAVIAADPSVEAEVPQIEWSLLAKMRDKVTHQYWTIDAAVVWATAVRDVATIRDVLLAVLRDPK